MGKCLFCGEEVTAENHHCISTTPFIGELGSANKKPHCCPVCLGTGLVSKPPGIAGDQGWSGDSSGPFPCRACGGTSILWN